MLVWSTLPTSQSELLSLYLFSIVSPGMSFHIFAQNKLADIETLLIGGDLPICIVGQLYIKQLFSRLQSLVSQTGIRRKRWCGRLLYKLAARHQFTTFQYQPACLACTSKIECFSWIFWFIAFSFGYNDFSAYILFSYEQSLFLI